MISLVIKAWFALVWYDVAVNIRGYRTVRELAQKELRVNAALTSPASCRQICDAVDIAAVLYFKQVHCLQRSSVATRLLRNSGEDARLVIGVQMTPFVSHAWVELDGVVVNDKPYMRQKYRVLGQTVGGES